MMLEFSVIKKANRSRYLKSWGKEEFRCYCYDKRQLFPGLHEKTDFYLCFAHPSEERIRRPSST